MSLIIKKPYGSKQILCTYPLSSEVVETPKFSQRVLVAFKSNIKSRLNLNFRSISFFILFSVFNCLVDSEKDFSFKYGFILNYYQILLLSSVMLEIFILLNVFRTPLAFNRTARLCLSVPVILCFFCIIE